MTRRLILVALDELNQRVRFGTCKRSCAQLLNQQAPLEAHIESFVAQKPFLKNWQIERAAFAPKINKATRSQLQRKGFIVQDLTDLLA